MAEETGVLPTGRYEVETENGRTVIENVLLMVVEINDEMAEATGVDLTSGITAAVDGWQAAALVRELGLSGEAYIKQTGGRSYLILKGYAGLRPTLQGTRYLATNPQVVHIATRVADQAGTIGRGAASATGIAVIAYCALNIVEYILADGDQSLMYLLGTTGTDIAKFAASAAAGYLAGAAIATVTTAVAGPIIAAVVVGIAVSIALDRIDRHFQITETLVVALENAAVNIANLPQTVDNATDYVAREIYRWERSMVQRAIDAAIRRAMNR